MATPLLATKLRIPIPTTPSKLIFRHRLVDQLIEGSQRELTLIAAPAGFGKTSLLSEFVAGLSQPVAWLTLDEGDNDPIRFWTYLIEACRLVQPHIGESVFAQLQMQVPLPEETIPTLLVNDITGLERRLVLILDDYHAIHNPSIHRALDFLVDHMPQQIRLVISTRIDPPWPLARLRVQNRLMEIRAFDLRFNNEEAAAFLNQAMNLELSDTDISALEARTEGWIASLQLAAISMKGRSDRSAFIRAFTGSHAYVAEYLVEEVLQQQSQELRDFLLRTSILESMTASLCEAVSGQSEGAARLKEIQQANLFLVPLDDEGQWFRYHQLFADLLRARLHQSESSMMISALHQRAADWYEQAGMIPEAISHALAMPDYVRAAELIGRVALPMTMQAHVKTVEGWLRAIPVEYSARNPHIDMASAWLHLLRSSLQGAQPYLDRLEQHFSASTASADPLLLGEWLAIQSKVFGIQGQPAQSRHFAEGALRILPETELHIRSMAVLNLATACEQLLDFGEAARIYRSIVERAREIGDTATEILGASAEARMLLQQGRLHATVDVARKAVERLEESGHMSPFAATLYGELGQIYYYWHQLNEARQYMEKSTRTSAFSGYSDSEIYMHLTMSRMHQMDGDWHAADAEMDLANDLARRSPPAMVQEQVISQQVRVDLALGRLTAAEAVLQQVDFTFSPRFSFAPVPEGPKMTLSLALLYNSAVRVVLAEAKGRDKADLRSTIDMTGTLLDAELQHSHLPAALETLLIRSQLRAQVGDHAGSLKEVEQAVSLAEPEGIISPFVEEGLPIAQVLNELRQGGGSFTAFIKRILECFPTSVLTALSSSGRLAPRDPLRDLIEPLTRRELEVLQLIAAGESNQSIADRLVITLSAVKKHTGNIFRKLNVNSRTQALARAGELGLLSSSK